MSGEILATPIAYIYTLADPREPEAVRYVGVTKNPRLRYKDHLYVTSKKKSHNGYWLRSLLEYGEIPAFTIIDVFPLVQADDRERFWIAHYRSSGADLTNATDGGRQLFVFPPEVIEKMVANSKAGRDAYMTSLTPEQRRERMSQCWTPEAMVKRRLSLSKATTQQWAGRGDEEKQRISEKISTALRQYAAGRTPEDRAQFSQTLKDARQKAKEGLTPEERQKLKAKNVQSGNQAYATRRERYGDAELSRRRLEGIYNVPADVRSKKTKEGKAKWWAALTPAEKEAHSQRLRETLDHARRIRDAKVAAMTPEELQERSRRHKELLSIKRKERAGESLCEGNTSSNASVKYNQLSLSY